MWCKDAGVITLSYKPTHNWHKQPDILLHSDYRLSIQQKMIQTGQVQADWRPPQYIQQNILLSGVVDCLITMLGLTLGQFRLTGTLHCTYSDTYCYLVLLTNRHAQMDVGPVQAEWSPPLDIQQHILLSSVFNCPITMLGLKLGQFIWTCTHTEHPATHIVI